MIVECIDCGIKLKVDNEEDILKHHWYKIRGDLYCCPHCDIIVVDKLETENV